MNVTGRVRVAALLLAAATVAAPLTSPVAAPARAQTSPVAAESRGTIGISLAGAPSEGGDDPRAHRYIVGHLDAGESTTRLLEVHNDTDSGQQLEIYAGPASVDGGRFLPAEPGATSALTSWISVDTPTVQLPPRSSTEVSVTISTPRDSPSREHYGVIWASHTSSSTHGAGHQPTGVDLISRVGVRMYLSTGDEPPADPDFEIVALRPIRDALGMAVVVATVTNIGGRALDLDGTLTLTDGPGGLSAPAVPAEPVTLSPGETSEVPFRYAPDTALPTGEWQATLDLASGSVRRDSAQPISIESDYAAPVSEPAASGSVLDAGTLLVAVAALTAFGLLLAGWRAVRHRGA